MIFQSFKITMLSIIGKNMEAIDTFDVNSVAPALTIVTIIKKTSFFPDAKVSSCAPIQSDNPELFK